MTPRKLKPPLLAKALPAVAFLKEHFAYCKETGNLIWRVDRPPVRPGDIAGHKNKKTDAVIVFLNRKGLLAHRLIWKMVYGRLPKNKQIDHIDGNGFNNRLENLRLVDLSGNMKNRRLSDRNKSGCHGVWWNKNHQTWVVRITSGGRVYYLGSSKILAEAVAMRKSAEAGHGFHQNHGRAGRGGGAA